MAAALDALLFDYFKFRSFRAEYARRKEDLLIHVVNKRTRLSDVMRLRNTATPCTHWLQKHSHLHRDVSQD
jgi:hypothetical protein